jgi:hypothetical protein
LASVVSSRADPRDVVVVANADAHRVQIASIYSDDVFQLECPVGVKRLVGGADYFLDSVVNVQRALDGSVVWAIASKEDGP